MKFLKLLASQHQLKVETEQKPNEIVFMDKNKVFFIFQNHCQLWDLLNNSLINRSQEDDNIYFWTNPIPINETTIALVNLNLCEPQLATFDIKTNIYNTLYKFNKGSTNYDQIFYNTIKDEIMVVTKGKINTLYWFNDKQVKTQSFPEFNNVFHYDKQSTLAMSGIEYSETKKCCFTLNNSVDSKQYQVNNIDGIQEICCVQKYDSYKAIVGIIHKQKETSTVVIFDMLQGTNLNMFTINFPLDKLILSKFGWLAMRTTQEKDSTLQIQSCFESKQQQKDQQISFEQKITIPQQFRIWGDELPIATIDILRKNGSPQTMKLTTVRFAQKKDLYIKMLENLGFDQIFYNEIIGSVLNNIS